MPKVQRKACRRGEWDNTVFKLQRLLGFVAGRDAESYAAIVIGLHCGDEVEIGERNLFGMLRSEIPQSLANDGVILDFLLMLIAVHKNSGRHDRRALRLAAGRGSRGGIGTGIEIAIAVGLFLSKHLLFFQALLVHVVGDGAIAFRIIIVRRARIPPRIVISVGPGIAIAPATIAVAIAEPAAAKTVIESVMEVIAAKSVVQERTA